MTQPEAHLAQRPPLIAWVVPNFVTVLAICSGLTAMRFAFEGRFSGAILMICLAGLLDGLDGRLARRLRVTSRFGAALDNLSDFLAFGAAPAVVIYLWSLQTLGSVGWLAAVFYTVCCALRLARFLAATEDTTKPAWMFTYFRGIPSPGGAAAALVPMAATFAWFPDEPVSAVLTATWLVAAGCLMISTIPTFALKALRPRGGALFIALALAGATAIGFLLAPFHTLVIVVCTYLATIPLSVLRFERQRRRHRAGTIE